MALELRCKHCGSLIRYDGSEDAEVAYCTVCGTPNEIGFRSDDPPTQPVTQQTLVSSDEDDEPHVRMALFMGLFIGGFILAIGMETVGYDEYGNQGVLSMLAVLPIFGSVASYMVFWHHAWRAIQDGHARTTPGKAVGLMFVPLYNLYWHFQLTRGFAQDFNAYVVRHELELQPLPEGLYLASPILSLVAFVPFLGTWALLANLVIMCILIAQTSKAVNALPVAARATGQPN